MTKLSFLRAFKESFKILLLSTSFLLRMNVREKEGEFGENSPEKGRRRRGGGKKPKKNL